MRPTEGPEARRSAQAAEWHARMLEPESEAEVRAFEAWLIEHPDNPALYADMEAISALGQRLPRSVASSVQSKSGLGWRPALGFALGAAALLLGTSLVMQAGADPAYAAVSNDGPAVRTVRLKDGTQVVLDRASEIGVAFDRETRRVEVRSGRARFTVAEDPRPFRVEARTARVATNAPGAIFDVALSNDDVRVAVLAGRVSVTAGEAGEVLPVTVGHGWSLGADQGIGDAAPLRPGEERWPASRVRFTDAPLSTVLAQANRDGVPTIAVSDPRIAALPVSGVLDLRDTRSLARKLAAALHLRVEETSNEVRLTR